MPGRRASGAKPLGRQLRFNWTKAVSEEQWAIYSAAIDSVRKTGVPFMLGGGFALASFTGRWRDTKDIDFYIEPKNRDKVIAALSQAGFKDYFDERPYDRKWIYRSIQSGVIVDIIWAMANQRAQVDSLWFERASVLDLCGQSLLIVPPEELMWCKLYIMQRDHCDWTDVFNLLYAVGPQLDWRHLIWRLEEDKPLLKGLLNVYGWLCPKYILKLPVELWKLLGVSAPKPAQKQKRDHIRLLDSRGWFAALQSPDQKLEV
ncbi:MAG TPA: nucleotidyltransferase family protein [Patescibacteria group bacterium]|nr:nucleotidyltransferase family protein [Patescibacteria group bacterium]